MQVQTASGSSSAELTIEGMQEFALVRDFLYSRMRGTQSNDGSQGALAKESGTEGELADLLRAIKEELEGARRALESGGGS